MKALNVAGGVGWRSACYEYVTSDLSYEWELEKWGKDGMKKKKVRRCKKPLEREDDFIGSARNTPRPLGNTGSRRVNEIHS